MGVRDVCFKCVQYGCRQYEIAQVIGNGTDDVLLEAAEACPSAAIRIIDTRTRALIYP